MAFKLQAENVLRHKFLAMSVAQASWRYSDITDWVISNLTVNSRFLCCFLATFTSSCFMSTQQFCTQSCLNLLFLWLIDKFRTRLTNSCNDAQPCPLTRLTIRWADFLFTVCWRVEVNWRMGAWQCCHSALTPTSVLSLCISVTCVPRHWPAPINQPGQLLTLLLRPQSALSPLPSPFLTPCTSQLSSFPLCLHTWV